MSYDYYESVLELGFEGDAIVIRESRTTVQIGVQDGRRFRYGGRFLVAIDDDEIEAPRRIDSPPELLQGGVIECQNCGLSMPVSLQVVVTVGKNGSVTWIRPRSTSEAQLDGRVWAAVQDGLRRYQFRSALAQGRPVADYAVLQVQVVPPN